MSTIVLALILCGTVPVLVPADGDGPRIGGTIASIDAVAESDKLSAPDGSVPGQTGSFTEGADGFRLPIGRGQFMPELPEIVINELHYHPAEWAVSPGADAEDLQFLELYNDSATPVDLSDWSLSDGVTFTFPPGLTLDSGEFLVLAKDAALLQATVTTIPPGTQVLEWTTGNLANGGERVAVSDGLGALIDEVEYDDEGAWPTSPDGSGPSLELVNPTLPNELAAAWRASAGQDGTPGAPNSVFSTAPVVIDELPGGRTSIDSLPSVSVEFDRAVVGVVPGDLTVNGVSAVDVTGSGAGPYIFTGFASPAPGLVTVELLSGSIVDAGTGDPYAGDSWTYWLGQLIVINELHYHPDDTYASEVLEFLELFNAHTDAIDLTGWSVSDGIDLDFPPGTTINAGDFLVLSLDPASLEAATGYAGALQWANGRLNNNGERVAITDSHGNLVDEATFDDGGHWPETPDGDGPSLELVNPGLPNQFGIAWSASSGAAGTPGAQNSVFNALPAPVIVDARHSPPIPASFQDVTVTATVIDDVTADPTVTLYFRQDQSPPVAYSSMPMHDDGAHGDGAAGDRVYGAIVPGLADQERLDFYVEAVDGDAAVAVVPPGHDQLDSRGNPSQTFLCKFWDEALPEDFPTYHLIITEENRAHQEVCGSGRNRLSYDATFIDDQGTIYYNVTERYRGANSLNQNPASYRVDFNAGQLMPSEMGFDADALNFLAIQPVRQILGYDVFGAMGLPAPKAQLVRLKVNPTVCTNPPINEHIYANVERIDEDFLQRFDRFPAGMDEGNIYRGRYNGAKLEWEGFDPAAYRADPISERNGYQKINNESADDWTDLITLCDALWCSTSDGGLLCTESTYDDWFPANLETYADVEQWARWFATHMVLNNREGGIQLDTGDDYFVYFYPTLDHATMMPWDMDSVFTNNQYTIWRTNVPSIQRILRHDAFAPLFVGAIVELLENEFSQSAMDARIDALPDDLFPTPQHGSSSPTTKQEFKDWIAARHAFINAELERDFEAALPPSPYTEPDPVITLSGTFDQAGTFDVSVNGVAAAEFDVYPDGTWSHDYTLQRGDNDLVILALGRDGEEIDRIEASILYTPPCAADGDCDDGNSCTADVCVGTTCDYTVELDGTPCEDGDACTGQETCQEGICVAGETLDCDDSNPCTDDSCVAGSGCVNANVTDGTPCTDGLYCTEVDACQDGVCVAGGDPCTEVCEQCDDEADTCQWCIFDMDGSGAIASGDFNWFAFCYGSCYEAEDPCAVNNFDGDVEGCVASGDFSGFAFCYGAPCDACANCWPAWRGGARAPAGPEGGASLAVVAVRRPGLEDTADVLPASMGKVAVGQRFHLELWASRQSDWGAGLAAVHADLSYEPKLLTVEGVVVSDLFGLFTQEVIDPQDGTVPYLGGCAQLGEDTLGIDPAWVRVATLQVRARAAGVAAVDTDWAGERLGVSVLGEFGNLGASQIEFGGARLRVLSPVTKVSPDIDESRDLVTP